MQLSHTSAVTNDRVSGVTPSGRIVRTGTYIRFQDRANTSTPEAREYEAVVRWDGDDYDSPVSFDRLVLA